MAQQRCDGERALTGLLGSTFLQSWASPSLPPGRTVFPQLQTQHQLSRPERGLLPSKLHCRVPEENHRRAQKASKRPELMTGRPVLKHMHLIHRKLVLTLPPSLLIVALDTVRAGLDSRLLEGWCGTLGWGGWVHAYDGHHDNNKKSWPKWLQEKWPIRRE